MPSRLLTAVAAISSIALAACQPVAGPMSASSAANRLALEAAVANPARTADNIAATSIVTRSKRSTSSVSSRPTRWSRSGLAAVGTARFSAPYLNAGGGRYIAAASDRGLTAVRALAAKNPSSFGTIGTANFPVMDGAGTPVAPGTADVVLTFRNVHNWMMGDKPFAEDAFRQMYAMLRPGGTLGVVEHRLPEARPDADQLKSGYVKQSTVRRLAEQAGFRLVAASEVNANPRDTADYPDGVWTLPPTYRLKDQDRERYAAIGESDRMTLKFVKP